MRTLERPRRHERKLRCDHLDDRLLLSTTGMTPFAEFSGTLDSQGRATIPIDVQPQEFPFPLGGNLLLTAQTDRGITVTSGRHVVSSRANGRALLAVAAGDSVLVLRQPQGTPYSLAVGVAGDASGDDTGTRHDMALIRSDIVHHTGAGTPADIIGNRRFTLTDLALARRNFGASTSIRPLTVSLQI
jgi:hypothetical protein